jgi:hypothetical protein
LSRRDAFGKRGNSEESQSPIERRPADARSAQVGRRERLFARLCIQPRLTGKWRVVNGGQGQVCNSPIRDQETYTEPSGYINVYIEKSSAISI